MNIETDINKIGKITSGKYKDSYCLVLKKSHYINTESLIFYTVYKDNLIFKMSNKNILLL